MKKLVLLLSVILVLSLSVKNIYAQRVCAAHSHMEEQISESPEMYDALQALEQYTQKYVKNFDGVKATRIIPIYVHVIYNTATENISDAQIQSQIDVLNADYAGTNFDITKTPAEFAKVGNTGIQFVLAGITRKSSTKTSWGTADAMKKSSQGGVDPITPATHLNMWICNIGGGILGYAQFPGGAAATDGVVFSPQYCGTKYNPLTGGAYTGSSTFYLSAPFDRGRTATHEIGHYLNLRHIWGDGNCSATDYVNDTPPAAASNYGCPTYPKKSCTSNGGFTSDMFMNYMDYTDDACMYMFSVGQSARIWACLTSTRSTLGTTGGGTTNVAPVAKVNGPYTGTTTAAVSFSSTGSTDSDGTIASYSWNFGNGASSTLANPTYTYATAGTYTVSVTVTDNLGATNTASTTATITGTGGSTGSDVTVGTGTAVQGYPLNCYYGYERSASIYTVAEIGKTGSITKLAYYPTVTTTANVPVKIYVKMTTASTITSSTWATLTSGATLVYSGTMAGTTANVWKEFALTTTFNYTGGTNNLMVLVETNYGGTGTGTATGAGVRYSTATKKHMIIRKDSSAPTTKGTVSSSRPNIKISISGTARTSEVVETMSNIISVYPNPATNFINVYSEKMVSINIYSIDGSLVKSVNAASNSTSIEISDLATGVYVVKCNDGENTEVTRFVKQ